MAQKFTLNAGMREGTGSSVAKKLRRQGQVPAVIYGGDQRNYPVQIDLKEITDLLAGAESENVLVDLTIKGADNPKKLVLLQDVQHDVLEGRVIHVDFQAVKENEEIRASVPIRLTGEPEGVQNGGVIDHLLHAVEVNCLPKNLPEYLEFDVSGLDIGDALHLGEVTFPEGVEAGLADDVLIAMVSEPRKLEEIEPVSAEAEEPERIGEEDEEKEEGEEGEGGGEEDSEES